MGKAVKNKPSENDRQYKDVEREYLDLVELKKQFIEQLKKHPKNKILIKSIKQCNEDIQKMVKDARKTNTREYHNLLNQSKTQTNEIEYFKKNYPIKNNCAL